MSTKDPPHHYTMTSLLNSTNIVLFRYYVNSTGTNIVIILFEKDYYAKQGLLIHLHCSFALIGFYKEPLFVIFSNVNNTFEFSMIDADTPQHCLQC